ncbi:MAG: hypothetical protein LBC27_02995 [Spirochaetaceae bacterium]|jgi:hypothetical protein|nr:hypothetical protein [Spirochaetaceae bacterium]
MKSAKFVFLPFVTLSALLFFACESGIEHTEENTGDAADSSPYVAPNSNNIVNSASFTDVLYSNPVQKVSFSEGSAKAVINLPSLNHHNIYLVKVNKSDKAVQAKDAGMVLNMGVPEEELAAAKTAGKAVSIRETEPEFPEGAGIVSGVFLTPDGERVIRYDHPVNEIKFDDFSRGADNGSRFQKPESTPVYEIDTSTKVFHAQNEAGTSFNNISATLRATGVHSNIWIANANYDAAGNNNIRSDIINNDKKDKDNKITKSQAETLAEKFDTIYEKETALFGYEYGGGISSSDHPDYGGVDGDPKIQILVYDIFADYSEGQNHGVFGYFWSGDEFDDPGSNNAEIFYIDAHFTDLAPEGIYSTLAHEFQHMINCNQKVIYRAGGIDKAKSFTSSPSVWYNEMLSLLAEDIIDSFIDISPANPGHPIIARIPTFLQGYCISDPTIWFYNLPNVYYSYANVYALGAYMVRNFGGEQFIKNVMENDAIDIDSINKALDSDSNPFRATVKSFSDALGRYGEAMLFNKPTKDQPDIPSFNNTIPSGEGEISDDDYVLYGFDLWEIENGRTFNGVPGKGPVVWGVEGSYSLAPRNVILLSSSVWQDKTGNISITVEKPADPNVELYIMVR